MFAELTHNVVDLLSAIAVLLGLRLATRKTATFPYGLYKVENLVAAGLAGLVFVSAYEIARDAVLATGSPVRVDGWMLGVLVVTTLLPLVFSRYELRAGRAANSPALIADASEYRVHVATTGLVFVALLSEVLRLPLDRVAALLIVAVVVKRGWDLLRDAMRVLLDAALDPEALLEIRKVIDADPAVSEIRWVRTSRGAPRRDTGSGRTTQPLRSIPDAATAAASRSQTCDPSVRLLRCRRSVARGLHLLSTADF